ncbi:unnamed protein product [Calicophoron daubneyi]|uniref:U4/U6.U5 tri-snRNP-associated protein 1 n=1 Tax=Calicophoron daubneyi TaxID=300641 RepID=A0AAV2TNY3_CALDB
MHAKDHHKRRSHRSRDRERSPFDDEKHRRKEPRASERGSKFESNTERPVENTGHGLDSYSENSLSIEDTNALRLKLGLPPLEIGEHSSEDRIVDNQSENYVHVPAKDIRKVRESEAIKDRISVHKEKRSLYEKYESTHLYEPAEKDTSVLSWVEKIREKERIKKQALERAKLIAETDEQLAAEDTQEFTVLSAGGQQVTYTPEDLAGLKVEHKSDRFGEGKSIILTLKDKDVLAEDDADVLVNVNLVDDEKAEVNRENIRKNAGLAGIADEEDEDVLLGLRNREILSKYDAEIKGITKSQFILGAGGSYEPSEEKILEQLQATMNAVKQSLPDTELRVASEYYTPEEMQAKFKRRKRHVKARPRHVLTADELAAEQSEQVPSTSNLGSRHAHQDSASVVEVAGSGCQNRLQNVVDPSVSAQGKESADEEMLDELAHTIVEEDEMRGIIEKTINRVVKCKSSMYVKPEEMAARLLSRNQDEAEADDSSSLKPTSSNDTGGVVFDSTAEFYKSIGTGFQESMKQNARLTQIKQDAPDDRGYTATLGFPPIKQEPEEMSMSEDEDENGDEKPSNRWQTVGEDSRSGRRPRQLDSKVTPSVAENDAPTVSGVLDDEPRLDTGIFSALQLAEKKGYIEKGKEKRAGTGTMVNLMAKHFVQEEVRYDDIDAKFAKRDRYSGPLSEFKELKHFKPDVKLEYVDELGRQLNAKEAFRQLSHKFHGKGSGKNKIEKRMKKIKEEFLLKASTSSDTPLGTAEKLNKKLQSISQPYVILSGKNAAVKNLTK